MDTVGLLFILVVLIINFLIAFFILIQGFFSKRFHQKTSLMLSWFILIVPVIGLSFIMLAMLINFLNLNRNKNIDMNDVSFSQERKKILLPPEWDAEINYVPIQDAMAVSDARSLRRLILDRLRNSARSSISSIAAAVNSKDAETSHYAAIVIMDALSEYRSTVQDMVDQIRMYPEDEEINLLGLEYIHEIINQKIMSDVEQKSNIYIMDDVAENLFTYNLWYMTETHYLWLTDTFISIKDYSTADKWVSRARLYRPNKLETYKSILHLYFALQDREGFFGCLNELKESDIIVDEEVLNLFRLYS